MYKLTIMFFNFFIKVFRLLEVEGIENVPRNSKFVVTCTHRGWVDVIMLAVAIYPTRVHFMAKKELFKFYLLNKFLYSLNAFPVNRENPGPSTLKIPLKLLKENKVIGIFPSGTRSSEQVPLKRGAATIAVKSSSPLVPAGYTGPKNFKDLLKGRKATVRFGKPILLDPDKYEKKELIEVTLNRMEKEMALLEKN